MDSLKPVTYCGLYCGLCAQCYRIPDRAKTLRESMQKEGWPAWGQDIPRFKDFWAFLNSLADAGGRCNCREGKGGPPFCGIRKCARAQGVDACPFCAEYPCHRIDGLAKGYVNLLADGARMKQIGIEAWIAEQEERRKTGFAYADIRCHPYEVPDK